MNEGIILELLVKGIAGLYSAYTSDPSMEETREEVLKIKGIVENMRLKFDKNMETINHQILSIQQAIKTGNYLSVKNTMLTTINAQDAAVKIRIVNIGMMIYDLVNGPVVDQIEITVSQMKLEVISFDDDEDDEDLGFPTPHIKHVTMDRASSIQRIISELQKLEELHVFSVVKHETEDRINVNITTYAKDDSQRNDHILTTGCLYHLCQVFCDSIRDPRGAYAHSTDDGPISRRDEHLKPNACLITLTYNWPSPKQYIDFTNLVGSAMQEMNSSGYEDIVEMLNKWFETKKNDLIVKNVYLLGETGEGKSTLANSLTGSKHFRVSHAGTGTFDISGKLVEPHGLLASRQHIKVYDTPGMNDGHLQDRHFQHLLYEHLLRENTVSSILLVSKTGSRIPYSLRRTLSIYKKAFGNAFKPCLSVCIGLNAEKTKPSVLDEIKAYWVKELSQVVSFEFPSNRLYFYNAKQEIFQKDRDRLRKAIWESEVFMTRIGHSILEGVKQLQDIRDDTNNKKKLKNDSQSEILRLQNEISSSPRVRIVLHRDAVHEVFGLSLTLLPTRRERILKSLKLFFLQNDSGSDQVRKVIQFRAEGRKAVGIVNWPFLNGDVEEKYRIRQLLSIAQKKQLVLTSMGSKSKTFRGRNVEVCRYELLDVDDELNDDVFKRVNDVLDSVGSNASYAKGVMETLGNILAECQQSRG